MAERGSDRDSYFPAIEKKHGQPMSYWFDQMSEIADLKYAEQISYLRENHGFSQVHANALVLYSRGSKSAQRFNTFDEYLAQFDETKRATVLKIFKAVTDRNPDMERVIAWNQPMLKLQGQYVMGVTVSTEHILIHPISTQVLEAFKPRLEPLEINKKTFKVPVDWSVDVQLLRDMASARLAEFS